MAAKHTPTPWYHSGETQSAPIMSRSGGVVATPNAPFDAAPGEMGANAAFIVRAVNAHDALVTALAESIALYESSALVVSGNRMRCGAWINSARDALALAKKD